MNKTKVVLWAIVGLLALSLVLRFAVLSQAGVAGRWIFYLGVPIGGIVALVVLLLRLGLLIPSAPQSVHGSSPASDAQRLN